jgi:hypothetical protein
MQVVYEEELTAAGKRITEMDGEELALKIEVLKEGIKVLNEQLLQIKSEFPFTIEIQIKDEDWVNEETGKIKEILDKLIKYESELTIQYREIINVI